jgi:hypothetical protein
MQLHPDESESMGPCGERQVEQDKIQTKGKRLNATIVQDIHSQCSIHAMQKKQNPQLNPPSQQLSFRD